MVPEQKRAWFIVAAFGLALACFLALIPLVGVSIALAGFGVFGIGGLAPLLFRKKADPSEVELDERDKIIAQKATLGGGMSSYGAVILTCMATWEIYRSQGKQFIEIDILPLIVGCCGIVFFLARSITLLVLYGREGTDGQD